MRTSMYAMSWVRALRGPARTCAPMMVLLGLLLSPGIGWTTPPKEPAKITKEHELPRKAWKDWSKIKEEWFTTTYEGCLKRFKLKMKCGGCEYIYVRSNLSIDGAGKLTREQSVKEHVCGKKARPAFRRCLIEPLQKRTYPKSLWKMTFETMLGTGLSC